jgi:hypothetical protein
MAERIRYLCNECDARFNTYKECLSHVCKLTLDTVPDVEHESVVSEAYKNYRYVLYCRNQLMLLFPEAISISEVNNIREKSSKAKKMCRLLKKAESSFLLGSRRKVDFPSLGDLTFSNVCQIQKYRNFAISHFRLVYKHVLKTFPEHYHTLWSKAEFQFWPFFYSPDAIFTEIFCKNLIKFENHSFQVFKKIGWQTIDFEELAKFICKSVVSPLFQYLSEFVVSCVVSKKLILNENWKDLNFEIRYMETQLRSVCGGEWFTFFVQLPNTINYFLSLYSLPSSSSVRDFICLDSITKTAIGHISRGYIPLLCISSDYNYICEKYGNIL